MQLQLRIGLGYGDTRLLQHPPDGLMEIRLPARRLVCVVVGSFNYDQRSLYLNTEIGPVFEQADIAGPGSDKFGKNINKFAFKVELVTSDRGKESLLWHGIKDGKPVIYDAEPYVGRGTKLAVWFMRLLPVDWLL